MKTKIVNLMNSEFYTMAKNPNQLDENEDRFINLPGTYAVIDGVSDKSGLRYDGQTKGQIAGQVIEDVICHLHESNNGNLIEAETLLQNINAAFKLAPQGFDADEAGGAQLVVVQECLSDFRFIIIGDAGLRINGSETYMSKFLIDDICSCLRTAVWNFLNIKDVHIQIRNEISRAYTINGLGVALSIGEPWINENDLEDLRQNTTETLKTILPNMSLTLIEIILRGGLRSQPQYVNRIHKLGYPCVNGSPIPSEFIVQFDRKRSEIDTIELFSDGYFGCPQGQTVSDWENHFQYVETVDPNKVGDFRSTKGSSHNLFTDDRTILILSKPTDSS